jgi:hypothetical protein
MFAKALLSADVNSPTNRWLAAHPLVLGLLFLAIGGALLGSGYCELRQGVSHDRYGNEIRGGMAKFLALFRIVAGAGLCVFALYKMVAG